MMSAAGDDLLIGQEVQVLAIWAEFGGEATLQPSFKLLSLKNTLQMRLFWGWGCQKWPAMLGLKGGPQVGPRH